MTDMTPAEVIRQDEISDRAPDPRKHYACPEELLADIELNPAERFVLLTQWKDEVDGQLKAESEGMSASDPIQAEARIAGEARRVNDALEQARQAGCA